MPPEEPEPHLRRDAARNRAAVLAAARRMADTRGLELKHADLARAAGVGMGTVYRRFPTHDDLVEALFTEHIHDVVRVAVEALDAPTGWIGLEQFMVTQLEQQADNRGLRDLIRDANNHPRLARFATDRIGEVARELIARAHAEGSLAPGVAEGDLITIHLMVTGLMDATSDDAPDLWRRGLAMALSGLRQAGPLPGAPLDDETAQRIQGHSPRAKQARPAKRSSAGS